jgi:hypothetical protein
MSEISDEKTPSAENGPVFRCSSSSVQILRGVRIGPSVLFDGPRVLISTGVRELNVGGTHDIGGFVSY